jgi:uncharacterized repeat protein (TIGR01451 family)
MDRRLRSSLSFGKSSRRALSVGAVVALLAGVGLVSADVVPAAAASGTYAISVDAPTSVVVGLPLTYSVTVSCTTAPCTGVLVDQTLAPGLKIFGAGVQTGVSEVVASYTNSGGYGADLEFALNPIATNGPVTFNVSVVQDQTTASQSTAYAWNITSDTLSATTASTTTTGATPLSVQKSNSEVVGGDNRTIVYSVSQCYPGTTGVYETKDQVISDVFPSTVTEVSNTSTGSTPGTWSEAVGTPDAGHNTWTFTPSAVTGMGPDPSFPACNQLAGTITVSYPAASFPTGTSTSNTATIAAEQLDGTPIVGAPATTNPPPFLAAAPSAPALGVTKFYQAGAGANDNFLNEGIDVGISGVGTVSDVMVGDPGTGTSATLPAHLQFHLILLDGNAALRGSAFHWEMQYTLSGAPTTWLTTPTAPSLGTQANFDGNTSFCFDVTGSVANGCTFTQFTPAGQYVTGWRLVAASAVGESLPAGAQFQLIDQMKPQYRSLADGTTPSAGQTFTNCATGTATTATSPDDPTAVGNAITGTGCAPGTVVSDAIPAYTVVTAPTTMTVGATGQTISLQLINDDSRTLLNLCSPITLPIGVVWTGAQITAAHTVDYRTGQTAPVPTVSIVGATPAGQQVVNVCYDQVPGRTNPLQAVHYDAAFDMSLPVSVLPQAYSPPASDNAVSTANTVSSDPALQTVPFVDHGIADGADPLNTDPYRTGDSPVETSPSTILSSGGLQLAKQVSADGGATYSVSALAPSPSTVIYQLFAVNNLPLPVTNATVCDVLPTVGDANGSQFAVTAKGAVTNLPAGATAQYSTDATNCTTGTWTPSPTGAIAIRITNLPLPTGTSVTMTFPAAVPAGLGGAISAINGSSITGTYNGSVIGPFTSNTASITTTVTTELRLVKELNGGTYPTAPGPLLSVGSQTDFTYSVTNAGNTMVRNLTVTDIAAPGGTVVVSCPATIAAFATAQCTASGTAIIGQYSNTAVASGTTTDNTGATVTVTSNNSTANYLGIVVAPTISVLATTGAGLGLINLIGALLLGLGVPLLLIARRRIRHQS